MFLSSSSSSPSHRPDRCGALPPCSTVLKYPSPVSKSSLSSVTFHSPAGVENSHAATSCSSFLCRSHTGYPLAVSPSTMMYVPDTSVAYSSDVTTYSFGST